MRLHPSPPAPCFAIWGPFPQPRLKPMYGSRHGPGSSTTTWATAGGLKLSLTVPRSSYPRNALAQVAVGIRNISHHTVGYQTPPGVVAPGVTAPQVEVLDHSGRIVFPPAMPDFPPWPGPAPSVIPVRPGQAVHTHAYIVVRGARVRASVTFTPKWGSGTERAPDTLRTHPIWVKLTSEPAPTLTLHTRPSGPVVDVTRPPGVTGSPLKISLASCPTPSQPLQAAFDPIWSATDLRVIPGCAPVQGWDLQVAWLNHPVAALDYSAPQPTPTAGPALTPTPVPTRTPVPSPTPGPSFDDLLHRAARAEAAVHSLHATGQRTSVDSSAQMHLDIQADCRSSAGQGIPILARSLVTGRQSQQGKIDRGYIVGGPVLRPAHRNDRAWFRSSATHGRWQATDLRRKWKLAANVPDPVFSPDPAYLNQVCPDLIRLTYLSAPLPGARHTVLGATTIDGRRVWHLREHQYFNLDLFVDTRSFQLRRLVLWDGSPAASHWRVRFDYSRATAPIHIPGG